MTHLRQAVLAFWRDFCEAHCYVRDPHGWEARIRAAQQLKYAPRPVMHTDGQNFHAHPAMIAQIQRMVTPTDPDALWAVGFGLRVYVSDKCVQQPPSDGWPDVIVPERPRLRP